MTSILVSATAGTQQGGNIDYTGAPSALIPADIVQFFEPFALLIVSCLLLAGSLFLFNESVKVLRWVSKEDEGAPDPHSGFVLVYASVILVVAFWMVLVGRSSPQLGSTNDLGAMMIGGLFWHPAWAAPGFLLASILPCMIGLSKLLISMRLFRRADLPAKSPSFAVTLTLFEIINLAASIVTLGRLLPTFR